MSTCHHTQCSWLRVSEELQMKSCGVKSHWNERLENPEDLAHIRGNHDDERHK